MNELAKKRQRAQESKLRMKIGETGTEKVKMIKIQR